MGFPFLAVFGPLIHSRSSHSHSFRPSFYLLKVVATLGQYRRSASTWDSTFIWKFVVITVAAQAKIDEIIEIDDWWIEKQKSHYAPVNSSCTPEV